MVVPSGCRSVGYDGAGPATEFVVSDETVADIDIEYG